LIEKAGILKHSGFFGLFTGEVGNILYVDNIGIA